MGQENSSFHLKSFNKEIIPYVNLIENQKKKNFQSAVCFNNIDSNSKKQFCCSIDHFYDYFKYNVKIKKMYIKPNI